MAAVAPKGPILPRKSTARERITASCGNLAFQVGVLIAVERNRLGLTQAQLAKRTGTLQSAISDVENGEPATNMSDATIERIFSVLSLGRRSRAANYIKWWRDNAPRP
jgi:ribosome-binding protein aMBF1 (putative translation factor)